MDDERKSILHAIIDSSETPIGDLLANLAVGRSSFSNGNGKRGRSNSNLSDRPSSGFEIIRRPSSGSSGSNSPGEGPSSPKKRVVETEEEPKEDVDEVVEQVKRSKLDQYESAFLGSIVEPKQLDTTFETVCLPEDVIDVIRSMISLPLLCPDEFNSGILKQFTLAGAILYGPPGTGKTLFAQALAKESGSRMISIKPSDILHMYVGESERLVRALFKLARRLKPCVIFIDEMDALFGARTSAGQQSSARWHTSMITEFMQEMDGLVSSQVIVLGATNRPFDLDDAVLRRLPCRVMIDLPEKAARQEILKVLLREETLADDVKLDVLAQRTAKYSGSDLKNLCLAAVFNAVKENADLPWKTGVKADVGKGKAPAIPRPSRFPGSSQIPDSARFEEITDSGDSDPKPNEPSTKADEPSSKPDGPTAEPAEPTPKPDEPNSKPDEPASKSDNPSGSKSLPTTTRRVIANRHFTRALTEIAPSTSDAQNSLNEIRTWNSKFGSGAGKGTGLGLGAGIGGGIGGGIGSGIGGYGGVPGGVPGYTPGGAAGYTPGGLGGGMGGYAPGRYTGAGAGSSTAPHYNPPGGSGSGSGLGYSGPGIGSGIGASGVGSGIGSGMGSGAGGMGGMGGMGMGGMGGGFGGGMGGGLLGDREKGLFGGQEGGLFGDREKGMFGGREPGRPAEQAGGAPSEREPAKAVDA
ncbi:hypothetical protein FRC07_012461 [Ceratobasidium sp. 392]|nr:hypothetical protein FRC07_012461 [Ceratobasidium sp. 392]